jgi:hypothetical protein
VSNSVLDHTSAPPRVAGAVDVVGVELEIRIMSGDYTMRIRIAARYRIYSGMTQWREDGGRC